MAETVRIEIKTEGDFKSVDQLLMRLRNLQKEIGALNRGLKVGATFARDMNKIAGSSNAAAKGLNNLKRAQSNVSKAARTNVRDFNGMTSNLKKLNALTATMTKGLHQRESFAKRLTATEEQLAKAEKNRTDAQAKYLALQKTGANAAQLANAKKQVDLANQQASGLRGRVSGLQAEVRAVKEAEVLYAKLGQEIKDIEASGKQAPTALLNSFKAAEEQLGKMNAQLSRTPDYMNRLNKLGASANIFKSQLASVRALTIGVNAKNKAIAQGDKDQAARSKWLAGVDKRYVNERAADVTRAVKEEAALRKWLSDTHMRSIANEVKAQQKADQDEQKRMDWLSNVRMKSSQDEQKATDAENARLAKQAEWYTKLVQNSNEYAAKWQAQQDKEAAAARAAADKTYIKFDKDLRTDNARLAREAGREAEDAARRSQAAINAISRSLSGFSRVLGTMMGHINRFASSLRTSFGTAFSAASRVVSSFTTSASSSFARLRSYLDSTGKSFLSFGNIVHGSMRKGADSMQEFYAAGFSLMASGAILNRFGDRIFGAMGSMVDNYTSYERALNRAAIAGATPTTNANGTTDYQTNPQIIQDIIFGLQRGVITNKADNTQEKVAQSTFGAEDIAQAMYYYSSAIGQPVTSDNMMQIGETVSKIMTMAQVTQTDVQTAMKGVLNVAMEFGINPRDTVNTAKDIQNIAAQMGYLANVSSMEVPDIAEAFKMLGPMAHILSDKNKPGAGLDETMALTFFASEMGLRGGNVGRGINQMLTTLLDPTDKAVGLAATGFKDQGFGDATKENWQKFFFNAQGELKGGLTGLFHTLAQLPIDQSAQMLAALFTTNATRSVVAIEQAMRQHGGLEKWLKESGLSADNPMEWLSAAQDAYIHTLFGSMDNLKNAWFQVQAAIVDGIKGPLITAFNMISQVLYKISDVISNNPMIAKFVGALAVGAGVVATFAGGLLVLMGTLLLLARGFAMIGAAAHPLFVLFSALPRILLTLSPVLLLLAAVSTALYLAWTHNFMGMRDAVNNFIDNFSFEQDVMPQLRSLVVWLERIGKAFSEFVGGILLGVGGTNNLGALLSSIFGPLTGGFLYKGLLNFSDGLENVRKTFVSFIRSLSGGASIFGNIGRAIQQFIEQMLFGFSRGQGMEAQGLIGRVLGIDHLSAKLANAANQIRSFVGLAVSYFGSLKDAIFGVTTMIQMPFGPDMKLNTGGIAGDIRSNIEDVLASISGDRIKSILGNIFGGIATGFAAAMLGAAHAVELLTRALANAGQAGAWISKQTESLLGFSVTLEGIARAVGTAIGLYLGARLITALVPGIDLVLKLGTGIAQLGVNVAGGAIQLGLFAAKIALVTATTIAQIVAVTALMAIRIAIFGIETAMIGVAALRVAMNIAEAESDLAVALALIGVDAAMLAVIATGLIFIGVGVALFAIFAAIGAAMLIHTAVTQGLSAAWDGAVQMFHGFMDAVTPFVNILLVLGGAIVAVVSYLAQLVGVGNSFYAIGVLMGISLGLVVIGFIALLVPIGAAIVGMFAWIAALVLANLPLLAIIAGIALLALGLSKLGYLDDVVHMIGKGFDWLASNVSRAFGQIADGLDKTKMKALETQKTLMEAERSDIRAKYQALEQADAAQVRRDQYANAHPEMDPRDAYAASDAAAAADARARADQDFALRYPNQKVSTMYGPTEMGPIEYINYQIDQEKYRLDAEKRAKSTTEAVAQGTKDGWQNWIQKAADKAGLGQIYKDIAGPDGLLDMNEIMKNLSPENMKTPQYDDTSNLLNSIFPEYEQYQKKVDEYNQFLDVAKQLGKDGHADIAKATRFYAAQGWDIPIKPPSFQEFIQGVMDGGQDAENALDDELTRLNEFTKKFAEGMAKDVSLPQALQLAFSRTPQQGTTIAAYLGANAETLVGTLTEAAPWMNQVEFLMDAAIEGGLNKGVMGVNVHDALAPSLKGISEETGVAIEDMLKDIPTYVADDKYLPIAITGMMKGIGTLPVEVRQQIDNLGQDLGKELSWDQLSRYAVSQEQAGNQDWNFVNFLADQWDMTVADVTDYIHSKGIDVTDVQRALFPEDLRNYILAAGGEVSVIAAEAYDFATSHTYGPDDMTIEVTKREWAALDEATKIGLTNMGYTFIVGGQETADQAKTSMDNIMSSFRDKYGDGDKSRFQFLEDLGDGWVKVKDLFTNETIDVPVMEWAAYKESVQEYQAFLQRQLENQNGFWDAIDALNNRGGPKGANGKAVGDGTDIGDGTTVPTDSSIPGVPTAEESATSGQTSGEAWGSGAAKGIGVSEPKITTAVNATMNTIQQVAANNPAAQIIGTTIADNIAASIGPEFGARLGILLQSALNSAITQIAGGGGAEYDVASGTMGASSGGGSGPFDSTFSGYATTAATKFGETLRDAIPTAIADATSLGTGIGIASGPYDALFSGYGTSAASAFQNAFATTMTGWTPTTTPASYGTNGSQDPAQGYTPATTMPTAQTIEIKVNVTMSGHTLAQTQLSGLLDTATKFAVSWNSTIGNNNQSVAQTELSNLLRTAETFEDDWLATILTYGNETTQALLNTTLGLAQAINANFVASIYVADYIGDKIQNKIDQLNELDGKNATSTVQVTTTQTTIKETIEQPIKKAASGGIMRLPWQLLGENGRELANLPMGTRVYTASDTRGMFKAMGEALNQQPQSINMNMGVVQSGSPMSDIPVRDMFRDIEVHSRKDAASGDIVIHVDTVHIHQEADIDKLVARFEKLTGHKMELTRRGQTAFDGNRSL